MTRSAADPPPGGGEGEDHRWLQVALALEGVALVVIVTAGGSVAGSIVRAIVVAVVTAIAKRRDIATAQGKLQFRPTAAFTELAGSDFAALPTSRPQGSSSNTVVVMGERLILKGYRRLRAGASPELEMGLLLTEVVKYPYCAPLAGVLE